MMILKNLMVWKTKKKKEYDKTCMSIAAEINVIFKSLVNSV